MLYFLLFFYTLVYLLFIFGVMFSPRIADAVHSLAAHADAPYYTLLTYSFLHEEFSHLAFNCASLWIFARLAAVHTGGFQIREWLLVYFGGAAASAWGFLHLVPQSSLLGASGAISALVGYFAIRSHQIQLVIVLILLNLAGSSMGSLFGDGGVFTQLNAAAIAFSAHIIGLVYGAFMAVLLPRRSQFR